MNCIWTCFIFWKESFVFCPQSLNCVSCTCKHTDQWSVRKLRTEMNSISIPDETQAKTNEIKWVLHNNVSHSIQIINDVEQYICYIFRNRIFLLTTHKKQLNSRKKDGKKQLWLLTWIMLGFLFRNHQCGMFNTGIHTLRFQTIDAI